MVHRALALCRVRHLRSRCFRLFTPSNFALQMLFVRSLSTLFTLIRSRIGIAYFGHTSTRRANGATLIPSLRKRRRCSRTALLRYIVRVVSPGNLERDDAHRLGKEIATSMHELEREKERLKSNPDKLLVVFREMIQMCLWQVYIPYRFTFRPERIPL